MNSDITMCTTNDCPLRQSCKKHEEGGAKPTKYQSFAEFGFHQLKNGEIHCPNYTGYTKGVKS